jgi:hypothetical protein
VVDEVLAHPWEVVDHGNTEIGKLFFGAYPRKKHKSAGIYRTAAENGFGFGGNGELLPRFESYIYALHGLGCNVDLANPSTGEDREVRTLLLPTEDGMDVCNGSRASTAIFRVIGYGEESYSLLKTARFFNLLIEVLDDWDIKGRGTGFNPIFADLVAMPWVDRLNLVTEIVYETHHSLEIPAFAAQTFP